MLTTTSTVDCVAEEGHSNKKQRTNCSDGFERTATAVDARAQSSSNLHELKRTLVSAFQNYAHATRNPLPPGLLYNDKNQVDPFNTTVVIGCRGGKNGSASGLAGPMKFHSVLKTFVNNATESEVRLWSLLRSIESTLNTMDVTTMTEATASAHDKVMAMLLSTFNKHTPTDNTTSPSLNNNALSPSNSNSDHCVQLYPMTVVAQPYQPSNSNIGYEGCINGDSNSPSLNACNVVQETTIENSGSPILDACNVPLVYAVTPNSSASYRYKQLLPEAIATPISPCYNLPTLANPTANCLGSICGTELSTSNNECGAPLVNNLCHGKDGDSEDGSSEDGSSEDGSSEDGSSEDGSSKYSKYGGSSKGGSSSSSSSSSEYDSSEYDSGDDEEGEEINNSGKTWTFDPGSSDNEYN
jgi:hypothetical protein